RRSAAAARRCPCDGEMGSSAKIAQSGRAGTPGVEERRVLMAARLAAWLVHCYTAAGLVMAAGMAVMIARGGDQSFRWAFVLMLAATAIDATDGWLARKMRVKEVL